MIDDLRDLYQDLILDHGKRPRNFGTLEPADHIAEGHNPLCGDQLTLYLRMDGDTIAETMFEGAGCAISKASASLMTSSVKGKSREDADALIDRFHDVVTGKREADPESLGKLAVFVGVRDYPSRVKCATLAWHTLRAAFDAKGTPVSTE